VILLDTSGLLAAIDSSQRQHARAAAALREARVPFVLSPFVLAELDYLLATRVGSHAALALLAEVARGAYQLASFDAGDVASAHEVIGAHGDHDVGLADASIVVLSRRCETLDVLTLDERHFRTLRGSAGRPFRILPADAPD
jgi:predicted nucleic acid-binding protein